jgi:hypothetical protein
MLMRVAEMRGSEGRPVIGRIEVASPVEDYITSPETELTSRWCSNARPFVEPIKEAIANDSGVSHWCSFTHCRGFPRGGVNRPLISIAQVGLTLTRPRPCL